MSDFAVEVRHEQPADQAAIRRVNDEAFGGPDESRIVDAIRRTGMAAISLVADGHTGIVGHILFTPVSIAPQASALYGLGLAPMAVSPAMQRHGIGSLLVETGLRECARLGCQFVVVIGHPQFYPRFGFRPGIAYGLRSEFDVPDGVFMVSEITPGVLAEVRGVVRYLPEFRSA